MPFAMTCTGHYREVKAAASIIVAWQHLLTGGAQPRRRSRGLLLQLDHEKHLGLKAFLAGLDRNRGG